jgi:hypothetical protein
VCVATYDHFLIQIPPAPLQALKVPNHRGQVSPGEQQLRSWRIAAPPSEVLVLLCFVLILPRGA